jgi:hypothetical protein
VVERSAVSFNSQYVTIDLLKSFRYFNFNDALKIDEQKPMLRTKNPNAVDATSYASTCAVATNGSFTEVNSRRPRLVLGWVTTREDFALRTSVYIAVTVLT